MTRTIYDQFSKDCLEELLSVAGKVQVDLKVASEVREVDVFFTPNPNQIETLNQLGILGRIGITPALIEPVLSASYILGKPQNYALAIAMPLTPTKFANA